MLRRLYDIANVLTSLRLLEKVPTATSKRGCRSLFKWLGAPPPDQRYQPRTMPGQALADAEALQQVCPPFSPSHLFLVSESTYGSCCRTWRSKDISTDIGRTSSVDERCPRSLSAESIEYCFSVELFSLAHCPCILREGRLDWSHQ